MENQKIRRSWASITMLCLIVTQFTTGVFPIPISPVQSAYAAGFFIEKERIDAPESQPVAPGDTIKYKITIRNNDTKVANARIIDVVPPELEFVSATNSCSFFPATPGRDDEVICAEQPLAIGASRSEEILFRVRSNAQQCTIIENQADVWNRDANPPSGIAPAWSNLVKTPLICPDAEIVATKTADKSIVQKLGFVIYTINLRNTSTTTEAKDVKIIDPIPTGLMFIPGSPSDALCTKIGGNVECKFYDIPAVQNIDVKLRFKVLDTAVCGGIIPNLGDIYASNAPDTWTNQENITVECPDAELEATKVADKSVVEHLEFVTFTINVKNISTTDATDVNVVDPIPANLMYIDSSSDALCDQVGTNIECGLFDLDAGDDLDIEITFKVLPTAPCGGIIVNRADVYAANAPTVWTNQVDLTVICPQPGITASKTVDRPTLTGGSGLQRIVYTITVENTGLVDLTTVEVLDNIPLGLSFVDGASDSRCDEVGTSIECEEALIATGQTTTFELAFDADTDVYCGQIISNFASVDTDQTASTNTNTVTTTISNCPNPDFTATKTASVQTVQLSDTFHYTISITNTGQVALTGLWIIDQIPTGLTFIDGPPSDPDCFRQGNMVKCGDDPIAVGQTDTYDMYFTVNSNAQCGPLDNIAQILFTGNGISGYTNTERITVECPDAQLEVTKIANRSEADIGDIIIYTLRVTNVSTTTEAINVEVFDSIIPELTFIDDTPTDPLCSEDTINNEVVCRTASILPGQYKEFDVAFQVNNYAFCDNTIYNQAEAIADNAGPALSNSESVKIVCDAVLVIDKTDNRTTIKPGDSTQYEILVSNISGSDATNVRITDTLPSEVIFTSANAGGTYNSNAHTVTWFIDVDANDTEILTINGTISGSAFDDALLLNHACILNGACATDTTRVVDQIFFGCVEVIKEAFEPDGDMITPVPQFTFMLDGSNSKQNNGSGRVRYDNVSSGTHTVSEIVPATWNLISITPAGGVVQVQTGPDCAVVVFKNQQESLGTPRFTISKTDNRATAEPEDTLTYKMEIRNISNVDVVNLEVTDRVPDDTDFISASDSGSKNGSTVTWFFNINAGATKSFKMKVKIDDDADDGDVIFNEVKIKDGPTATDTTRIDDDDDDDEIRVTINDDPDPIDICHDDDLEYEIRLTNKSNSNEKVDVIAILDSDTDYRSSSDGGREKSGDRVEWKDIKVSRNSNRTLRLRVRVENGGRDGDTLRLRVGVSDGDEDTEITRVRNRGCDSDDDDGLVPDLTIDKTANTTEALAGSAVSYTITIRNTGGRDIQNAVLTDDYPEQYINITDPGGGSDAGGRLSWNLGTLRANSTTIVRYNARLKQGLTRGTSVRNTATIRSGTITRTDDHVIVVPVPPQTGLGGFIKSITKSNTYLSTYKDGGTKTGSETSRLVAVRPQQRVSTTTLSGVIGSEENAAPTNLPLMIWITTMLTGLGMGGMFGRKFLF